ncbi:hypothetical protein LCGC14_2513440 [marine sediment metagenome]|uniref:Uncharacterized protein n=1 Tax=marine sediment metagenome TaxID=412755 RepID=A0A0F9DRU3_9ZZZZ
MADSENANNFWGPAIVVTIPRARLAQVVAEEERVAQAIERDAAGKKIPPGKAYEITGWRYFWKMGRLPKKKPRRVYFLWDGAVRAYHKTLLMEGGDCGFINGNMTRIWLRPEIYDIDPIPMKSFRGFRYFTDPVRAGWGGEGK